MTSTAFPSSTNPIILSQKVIRLVEYDLLVKSMLTVDNKFPLLHVSRNTFQEDSLFQGLRWCCPPCSFLDCPSGLLEDGCNLCLSPMLENSSDLHDFSKMTKSSLITPSASSPSTLRCRPSSLRNSSNPCLDLHPLLVVLCLLESWLRTQMSGRTC